MASHLEDVPMSDDLEYEEDVEAELEVDELDPSDDEQAGAPAASQAPSSPSKKASVGKPGQRVPGYTLLPATKVENILQANGGLGFSKEGQFMLSIATEEFIKQLSKFAHDEAKRAKSNLVRYEDIALVPVVYQPEFSFLQEIIPRAMALKYAMEFRERRLQELEDENPALGGYIPAPYIPTTTLFPISASTSSKPKPKKASTNGKEKQTNGTSSAKQKASTSSTKTSRSASAASSKAESTGQRRSNRNGNSVASASASTASKPHQPSPLVNGHTKETEIPESDNMDTTGVNQPSYSSLYSQFNVSASPLQDDSPWTSQPIGPASGFLQGPAAAFARSASSGSSSNPGRTIYSQTSQPD